MVEPPPQHGHTMRDLQAVLFHDLKDLREKLNDVDTSHGHFSIAFDQDPQFLVKTSLVHFPIAVAKFQNSVLKGRDIRDGDRPDGFLHQGFVAGGQASHHSHIDPDDLSVMHLDIPGVRVRVEKTILHDLFDIIVDQLPPDFLQVISPAQQVLAVIDGAAADIFHDQHP